MNITRFIACILLAAVLASCTKDGDIIYVNDDDLDDTRATVYFLYGDDKMGDLTYYDAMYRGVMKAANENDMLVLLAEIPPDTAQLSYALKYFFSYIKEIGRGRKNLLVIGNDNYETMLHQYEQYATDNPELDILLVDSRDTTLAMHTLYFPLYGACYQAGCVVNEAMTDVEKMLILNANKSDPQLIEMRNGFVDGVNSGNPRVCVDSFFIAETAGGYNMADSAYHYAFAVDSLYQMVLPLCGGTTQGLLRYNREHNRSFYTIGIDSDMQTYSSRVPFSIVKHLDTALNDWITRWVKGEQMPDNEKLGLESGYTELLVADGYKSMLEPTIAKYKQVATEKENEYERYR